jgi:hypothetical protein
MKFAYALPALFLVAVACSDSVTDPSSKLVPSSSARGAVKRPGDPPPPPVDAAVVVCVNGACTVASGAYFTNGSTTAVAAALTAAAASTDGTCTFPGPSWLKFHDSNTAALTTGATGSAKGKIECSHTTATGAGTVTIAGVTYELAPPFTFQNSPDCAGFCASFTATVTLNGVPAGTAAGAAFEQSFFDSAFCFVDESGVPQCFNESDIG